MVTLKDLAQQLNISAATASRALAGSHQVSEATVKRVQALAEQLGYLPNPVATSLRRGHNKLLGVITPHLNNNFFGHIITGIEAVASQAGYQLLVCQSNDDVERERQNLEMLLHARVAGILLSLARTTHGLTQLEAARRQHVPVVFFDRYLAGSQVSAVGVDDRLGGYLATRHLLDQGYQRIAHFAGPQHISIYRNRRLGYEDALREARLPVDENLITTSDLQVADGTAGAQYFLALTRPPDAIFSASDFAAVGGLQAVKAAGKRVPTDFGIVGFSNEFFAQFTEPGLTSIEQHGEQIGRAATSLLFQLLAAGARAQPLQHVVLPPKLAIRASSQRQ